MRRPHVLVPVPILALLATGCPDSGPETRALEMSAPDLVLEWGITRDHELACGGDEMAGGALRGEATFAGLGRLSLEGSAAWNIGARIADPSQAEFEPEGPAGGPFAPVLGPGHYPLQFGFDPATGQCGSGVAATGDFGLTDPDGAAVFGRVMGGETHRLDFVEEGDGIETFVVVEFDGGTGRFVGASGSVVLHTIARFDFDQQRFVIDLARVLPGGTLRF
jgi:hypothetical protein